MPLDLNNTSDRTQLLLSQPGVARDGTRLSRRSYSEAQWCRWYQNVPRKMLGYREQTRKLDGIPRAIDIFSDDGYSFVHAASGSAVNRTVIDESTGLANGVVDRTPAGYAPSDNNNWQLAQLYNTADNTTDVWAVATPNASVISTNVDMPLYHGDILGTSALSLVPGVTVSGGLAAVNPFIMAYGHDGIVQWPNPVNPLDWTGPGSGSSRPVADKIVRGYPMRGSAAPAAILWSLSSLILGQFVGGSDVWDFTAVTTAGSILSSNGVIEHNGIFYWPTTSGFSQFNGVLRDLPNNMNKDWFLKNLNWSQRQKVFGFKVPRWNELWWCFPYGSATECNWAVICNLGDGSQPPFWYDTPLPNGGRSAAQYDVVFPYPIMSGVDLNSDTGQYSLWQHEYGLDEVSGAQSSTKAIRSFYVTSEFNYVVPASPGQVGNDRATFYSCLEPDFDQVGDLNLTVITRANARTPASREKTTGPLVIEADPDPNNELIDFKITGRLSRFKIESNSAGGNFVTGAPVIHFQPGDGRRKS